MDQEKYLILINGQDRTDSVAHFQLESEYCEIIYTKSSKAYHYRRDKVQVLELRQRFKADDHSGGEGDIQPLALACLQACQSPRLPDGGHVRLQRP